VNEAELAGLSGLLASRLDVQHRDSIRQTIKFGTAHSGRIDGLINNASFSTFGVFEGTRPEDMLSSEGAPSLTWEGGKLTAFAGFQPQR